jgi:hypothetical protein
MSAWLRSLVLLAASLVLVGAATPAAMEDHSEPGFCSADCPVQHPGHGAAISTEGTPGAAHRLAVVPSGAARSDDAERLSTTAPDAPRAPPAA